MIRFEVWQPQSLSEACSLLAEHNKEAKIIAGGQNLIVLLRRRLIALRYLINIKGLPDLENIGYGEDGLKLGALTTHRAIEKSSLVQAKCPMLAELERELGCMQMRNWGTIGGNICQSSPATDLPPALIALEGRVKAISVRGERVIPLDDFFVGYQKTSLEPDEIVAEIQVPELLPYSGGVYYKQSVRFAEAPVAAVGVVIRLSEQRVVEKVRIVLQGVGKIPLRASEAEKTIMGEKPQDRLLEEAATLASKAAQPRSEPIRRALYKRELIKVLTKRAISEAIRRALQLPR